MKFETFRWLFPVAITVHNQSRERVLTDERILGTDDFVGRVLGEADQRTRHLFSSLLTGRQVQQIIETRCKKEGISIRELRR